MNLGILQRLGLLIAPDLAMAFTFAFAWRTNHGAGAAVSDEYRFIMIIEGLSILASALVGIYLEISLIFFPLIIACCILWYIRMGAVIDTRTLLSFTWYVTSAFIYGIMAYRGRFGMARENPAHPHRRYDRMFILYIMTSPIPLALWIAGSPLCFIIWGTIYYTALAAVDTVLRNLFDRIPQGILRRLRGKPIPELGICGACMYVQPAIPPRRRRLIRCALSATNSRFSEHPVTPMSTCEGFRSRDGS